MTDTELLELAAKAAGIKVICPASYEGGGLYIGDQEDTWNPLHDDGDALRLAVNLGIYFLVVTEEGEVSARIRNGARTSWREPIERDPYAATRRAIVRAAAEIGKEMK